MKRFAVQHWKFALTAGIAMILPMLAGCQTLGQTPEQNAVTVQHTMATNWYQIGDDAENLLLLNSPLQLSVYPVPLR